MLEKLLHETQSKMKEIEAKNRLIQTQENMLKQRAREIKEIWKEKAIMTARYNEQNQEIREKKQMIKAMEQKKDEKDKVMEVRSFMFCLQTLIVYIRRNKGRKFEFCLNARSANPR